MGYLIDILIGAVSRIITGELEAHVEPMAGWVIERAVKRLSSHDCERFREEWLAHVHETPGAIGKIWHAVGCYLCSAKLAKVRLRHIEGTVKPDGVLAFARWLIDEAEQFPDVKVNGLPPDARDAFRKKLVIKLQELTEDEVEFVISTIVMIAGERSAPSPDFLPQSPQRRPRRERLR